MAKQAVDNLELTRWRSLSADIALSTLADHVKQDRTFSPKASGASTRWHVHAGGMDFEILCTGPKFFDTRTSVGGGGAVDLAMYLLNIDFKQAARLLRSKGL